MDSDRTSDSVPRSSEMLQQSYWYVSFQRMKHVRPNLCKFAAKTDTLICKILACLSIHSLPAYASPELVIAHPQIEVSYNFQSKA